MFKSPYVLQKLHSYLALGLPLLLERDERVRHMGF
jgi:hypothetical protein